MDVIVHRYLPIMFIYFSASFTHSKINCLIKIDQKVTFKVIKVEKKCSLLNLNWQLILQKKNLKAEDSQSSSTFGNYKSEVLC